MTRYLVGIDNGSQSTKVFVFDERGNIHSQARQALLPTATPEPGTVEHPDDDLWESIGNAASDAIANFPGDVADIAGVGLCTIRYCRALLKADGTLASPVMSWMDARVSRPYVHDDPNVHFVTTSSGYITHRMTGEFKDTAANYQGVWPISTDRWEWLRDDEGFADFGIGREMLFELVMPGDLLGHVTEDASRRTGIPAGLPVFATANDKAVEALGSALRSPETLLVSLGTYIASMTVGDVNRAGAEFWSNFASLPHRYLYESCGIRRGMWTVSWWRDLLGDAAAIPAARLGMSADQFLDSKAARVPPGSEGLTVILDWLAPTGQPFKKGAMLGFDARHGRYHVHRAILEGIALTIYRCAKAMERELGHSHRQLVVSGGGSNSDLFTQIFADVFGSDATRTKVNDAVGLGSAICAAVGLGLHPSWDAAIDQMVSAGASLSPDPPSHALYEKLSEIYDSIPAATDRIFEQSFRLFG